jgi:histidyl-tRNA synthetase
MERLIDLLDTPERFNEAARPHAYLIRVGGLAEREGAKLSERLRDALPGLRLISHCGGGSFKSQFKRADKSGAAIALILGDDEARDGLIGVKHLRKDGEQATLKQSELTGYLQSII